MLQMLRPLNKVRSIRKKEDRHYIYFQSVWVNQVWHKNSGEWFTELSESYVQDRKKCKEKDPVKMFAMCSTVMIKHWEHI